MLLCSAGGGGDQPAHRHVSIGDSYSPVRLAYPRVSTLDGPGARDVGIVVGRPVHLGQSGSSWPVFTDRLSLHVWQRLWCHGSGSGATPGVAEPRRTGLSRERLTGRGWADSKKK